MLGFFFTFFVCFAEPPPRVQQIQNEIGTFTRSPWHDGKHLHWKYYFEMRVHGLDPLVIDVTETMKAIPDLARREFMYRKLTDDLTNFFNLLYEFKKEYREPKAELTDRCSRAEKGQAGSTWLANAVGTGLLISGSAAVANGINIGAGCVSSGIDFFLKRWRGGLVETDRKRQDLDSRFSGLISAYQEFCPPVAEFLIKTLQAVTEYSAASDWQKKLPRVLAEMQKRSAPMATEPIAVSRSIDLPAAAEASPVTVLEMFGAFDEAEYQLAAGLFGFSIKPNAVENMYRLVFSNHNGLPFNGEFSGQENVEVMKSFVVLLGRFFNEYRNYKGALKAWLHRIESSKDALSLVSGTAGVCVQAAGYPVEASGITLGAGVVGGLVDQARNKVARDLASTHEKLPAFDVSFHKMLEAFPRGSEMRLLMERMLRHMMSYSEESWKRKLPGTFSAFLDMTKGTSSPDTAVPVPDDA